MHQVNHPLEQVQLITHTATNDDALPTPGAKGSGDYCLYVVATVETDQAELSPHAMLDEPGPPDLHAVRYRLRIPRPRHPIRIEPDHEHPQFEGRRLHRRRLRRGLCDHHATAAVHSGITLVRRSSR
jgi:hypothetical protein